MKGYAQEMARKRKRKKNKVLRELTTEDGRSHKVWVEILPAAWEEGGATPDYSRRGRRRFRDSSRTSGGAKEPSNTTAGGWRLSRARSEDGTPPAGATKVPRKKKNKNRD